LLAPFLFWLFYFALGRSIFISYHFGKAASSTPVEVLSAFGQALRLDISTACYLLLLPLLLWLIQLPFRYVWFNAFNKTYHGLFILLFALIATIDLELYNAWGAKINLKALSYLNRPAEVWGSAASAPLLLLFLVLLVQAGLGWAVYRKWVYHHHQAGQIRWGVFVPAMLLSSGLMVIGLRGGFQEIPVNQSSAYYSKNQVLNHAAVNSGWNLIHSIYENAQSIDRHPYVYLPFKRARQVVDSLHHYPVSDFPALLTVKRPNIVLLIIEGLSADAVAELDGIPGITPNLSKLVRDGMLFTDFYANGFRTDQGMVNLMSAFPPQPVHTLLAQQDKFSKLPCLKNTLADAGYHSSFFFGGELAFGNLKSYLYFNRFDHIVDTEDFTGNEKRGKLGVHDEHVFQRQLETLEKFPQPFFSVLLTESSHEPYDIPAHDAFPGETELARYKNAMHYMDEHLGVYFKNARQKPWFENTLFVIVSDHAHRLPRNREIWVPARYRIPLLLYGEVLKPAYRGYRYGHTGSQVDVAATLLAQLGLSSGDYRWSKNLLDPNSPPFAFYIFVDGYGWHAPAGSFAFENRFQAFNLKAIPATTDERQLIEQGQAYMQFSFQQYLDL